MSEIKAGPPAVQVKLSCGHEAKRVLERLKDNKTYCWSCRKEATVKMSDAKSLDEFNEKYQNNLRIEGYGFETVTIFPCPGCAEPDFMVVPLADFEYKAMKAGGTCYSCGRSFKIFFHVETDSATEAEIVQTGGRDVPDWMPIKIRRI